MEEDLITFETAKLAKEKGFTLREVGSHTYNYFGDDGILGCISWGHLNLDQPAQVPQSLLQKWLREKHEINVVPAFSKFSRTYGYKIYFIENGGTEEINGQYSKFISHEKALEKGLQESLKLIK